MMWGLCSHTFCQIKAFSIIAFLQMRKFVPAPHCDHSFYVTWHLLCHRIYDMCDCCPKKVKMECLWNFRWRKKIRVHNEIGNCSGLTALLAHGHYYCCFQHQGRIVLAYCGKTKIILAQCHAAFMNISHSGKWNVKILFNFYEEFTNMSE